MISSTHSKDRHHVRPVMAGIWPFKKKSAEAEKQKIVTYSKDDHHAEEIMADRSHIEDDQYQAALDLLTNPHLGKESSGEVAKSEVVATEQDEETVDLLDTVSAGATEDEYEQSDDGYWYIKKDDGSFHQTAHVKADDGSFSPYSE
uniref:Uncharacterized protein n=2 Tax=environmental samples TaxID=68359 RepID=A0A075HM67_9EURY|nr:hypothetical protein [uncultured marine group II/III euryarchaeote KM3_77_D11]AIF17501.1 hypothetical protein [uncultured marine group II/III euryarchaeote KM3_77_F08]